MVDTLEITISDISPAYQQFLHTRKRDFEKQQAIKSILDEQHHPKLCLKIIETVLLCKEDV